MSEVTEKRGPGRPRAPSPAGLSPLERTREGLGMGEGRDPNEAVEAERIRIPLGSGQSAWFMNYPFEWDKFYYYTFHDNPGRGGRIQQALQAFYEHCTINGENVKRPSGSGFDYLMRLPLKYHQEDVERQRARNQALERQQNTLKNKDGIQEYGIDPKTGRAFTEGEAVAKQSVSDNPYA